MHEAGKGTGKCPEQELESSSSGFKLEAVFKDVGEFAGRKGLDIIQFHLAFKAGGTDRSRNASFRRGNGVTQYSRMTMNQMDEMGLSSPGSPLCSQLGARPGHELQLHRSGGSASQAQPPLPASVCSTAGGKGLARPLGCRGRDRQGRAGSSRWPSPRAKAC